MGSSEHATHFREADAATEVNLRHGNSVQNANLKAVLPTLAEQRKLAEEWKKGVESRIRTWTANRSTQTINRAQLEWDAEVVQYVSYVYRLIKSGKDGAPPLAKGTPLLGPHFTPPTYLHVRRWDNCPAIKPGLAYLRPLNVIHPFYYPELARCPQCQSANTAWEGWTATGRRDVHGLFREEGAIGYQLRCKDCEQKYAKRSERTGQAGDLDKSIAGGAKGQYCFATTNAIFWERWEHWEVPRGIPHFFKRCAITRELFNLIIEVRPSTTAAGLAENIKQLHLLEYRQRMLEYLEAYKISRRSPLLPNPLQRFSDPGDKSAYNDHSISDDMITEVFIEFNRRTRQVESEEYLRTLSAIALSLDNTFRASGKATIIGENRKRIEINKGGILDMVNEDNLIIAWRFCHSQANAEISELLEGFKRRCRALGVADPTMAIADNCCHVRSGITKVFSAICVLLDVFHFVARYTACIIGGTKNPLRAVVAQDISAAILKKGATKEAGASYWPKEDQEARITAAFDKWARHGGVWSAAASRVHAEQLSHIRKGCLARPREDIRTDGSRIESTHRGFNGLQRSFTSGLVMFAALCHDFVLRRNIRVASALKGPDVFVKSLFGSHHLHLVDRVAQLWNDLSSDKKVPKMANQVYDPLPRLQIVDSGERFGIVGSDYTATFGGFLKVKDEPEDELLDLTSEEARGRIEDIIQDLNIDPRLLNQPEDRTQEAPGAWLSHTALTEPGKKLTFKLEGQRADGKAGRGNSPKITSVSPTERQRTDVLDARPILNPECQAEGSGAVSSTQKRKSEVYATSEGQGEQKKSRTDAGPVATIHTFFSSRISTGPGTSDVSLTSPSTVHAAAGSGPVTPADGPLKSSSDKLSARLPLPDGSTKMTRSELLFSVSTGINIRSLTINNNEEFFLFMDMRAEEKWVSFQMTSKKWVLATEKYNKRLEEAARTPSKSNSPFIAKNPRALMQKLGEVETKITDRIAQGNYKTSKGSETFWRRHCEAVELVKKCVKAGDAGAMKKRKPATCARCRTIMYPNPSGDPDNHKKGFCADGVKQTLGKASPNDPLPDWPQPKTIFANGTTFNPVRFLVVLREVYEKVLVEQRAHNDMQMEHEAFAMMLHKRTITLEDGRILFKLFSYLDLKPEPAASMIVVHDGQQYLRLGCLED